MATGNSIIQPALKLLGVIGQGETPATSDSDDARSILNTMIENWNIQDMNVLPRRVGSFSISGSADSYTIGSGQTWNTTRPTRILAAQHVIASGVANPVKVVDEAEFVALTNYSQAGGAIAALYYTNTNTGAFTAGTVYIAPRGSNGQTINLYMLDSLPTFSDLVTTVALPTGYDQAIIYNLAVAIAPMFGRSAKVTPELAQQAADSLAAIRAANMAAKLGTPPGGPVSAAQG